MHIIIMSTKSVKKFERKPLKIIREVDTQKYDEGAGRRTLGKPDCRNRIGEKRTALNGQATLGQCFP